MPKTPWRYVFRLGLLLTLLLSITACEAEPGRYEFAVQPVGGPRGWPVWVEELTFDHTWWTPGGNLSAGFEHRPPRSGSVNILAHPVAAPESMQARWFSYRTQTFYEIDLELPDTEDLLREWYRDYPPAKYLHYLTAGFSGEGEVFVWWRARCRDCGRDRSHDFHAPIVESAYGEEAEGDPNWYLEQTQAYIDEGTMPSPW